MATLDELKNQVENLKNTTIPALTTAANNNEIGIQSLNNQINGMRATQTATIATSKENTISEGYRIVDEKATSVLAQTTEMIEQKAASVLAQTTEMVQKVTNRLNTLRSSLTGELVPLEVILEGLYYFDRDNAFASNELNMTVAEYDAKGLTAFEYDFYGKKYFA